MRTKLLAAASAIAALGLSTQAFAVTAPTTYTATYTGVVDPGSFGSDQDVENLFGGGDLTGDAITIAITYNITLGTEKTTSTSDEIYGGGDYYDPTTGLTPTSPILSATYTIDGHSYTYAPDYQALEYTGSGNGGYVETISNDTAGDSGFVKLTTKGAANSLSTLFTATGTGTGYLDTAFDANNQSDNIDFDVTQVAIAQATMSGAPEPSTWALMLAGVGLTGLALRRSHRVATVRVAAA